MRFPALKILLLFAFPAGAGTLSIDVAKAKSDCTCSSIGVAAQIVEQPATYFASTNEYFPTASTFKLPIAVVFLGLVDAGKFRIDQKISVTPADLQPGVSPIADAHPRGADLPASYVLNQMITASDNTAANTFIRICGGPARVTALLRARVVDGIDVATDEHSMNTRDDFLRNRTTPGAMVKLLVRLYSGGLLSPASTSFLEHALEQTKTFPGRIKGLLPPGTVVAHKTGTGGIHGQVAWAVNDVGVITLPDHRHLALAIFVQDSRANEAAADRLIAQLARAAFDRAASAH
jgi:beta-lactamase class A